MFRTGRREMKVTLTDRDKEAANELDVRLRHGAFQQVPLENDGSRYAKWYARLLTTLTMTFGESEVHYAQTDYVEGRDTARFVLFHHKSVLITDVRGLNGGEAPTVATRVYPRNSLVTFEVEASMEIDADDRQARSWPGLVRVTATYRDMPEPLVLEAPGHDVRRPDAGGEIHALVGALHTDLSG